MKILFQIPVNIRLKIGNVSGGSSPDTYKWPLFWKTKAWTKTYSLFSESIIYDGADDVKMLSVHCIFLIKFYITRNQYVRRTRQFCPKWPIRRPVFQKILIHIAYTLLPYWKHVHAYQKLLETKIYWVRKFFKCLGRVFLGISHFTGECAIKTASWLSSFIFQPKANSKKEPRDIEGEKAGKSWKFGKTGLNNWKASP